jgi:hypothetical protein
MPEVAGELGDLTLMDTSVHPPIVHRLHYVISSWSGDDIVEGFPCFMVSQQLASAIAAEELSGATLD